MDSRFKQTLVSHSAPPDCVAVFRTVDESSLPAPPNETLDNLGHSISVSLQPIIDDSSNSDYLSADDNSDSAIAPEIGKRRDFEEDDPLLCSRAYDSAMATSHCDEAWFESPPAGEDAGAGAGTVGDVCDGDGADNLLGLDWPSTSEHGSKPYATLWPIDDEDGPSTVGAGLSNLGNTCFLNAILQCFTHCVPLVQAICSLKHGWNCYRSTGKFCVICSLAQHIEASLASSGMILSPQNFVANLSYFSSSFQRYQQEDAHEFLQCFLARLDDSCNDLKKCDSNFSEEKDNIVKKVFGGRLVSRLLCCNCGHCSNAYEPLIDLSLEIDDVDSLPAALESFTKVEKIEDPDNKFTCQNCKEEVSIEKQYLLDQAPSVAVFHLKRFMNDGSYVERINKLVKFPLELDLQPYMSDNQNNDVELKYDVCAVVVHEGSSATFGHYYSFVRPSPNTWYRCDDSQVYRVHEEAVLNQEAYILFYAKCGTPWFSTFMETFKPFVTPSTFNYHSPKSVLDNSDNASTSSSNAENAPEMIEAPETPVNDLPKVQLNSTISDNKVEKSCSPSVLGEKKDSNQDFDGVNRKFNVSPRTPVRSPSPDDIYIEEPPVERFQMMRGGSKSADQIPCKRKPNKKIDKSAKKLLKSMPSSRRDLMLAALQDDSVNRSPASGRRKANTSRQLAAGSFR